MPTSVPVALHPLASKGTPTWLNFCRMADQRVVTSSSSFGETDLSVKWLLFEREPLKSSALHVKLDAVEKHLHSHHD